MILVAYILATTLIIFWVGLPLLSPSLHTTSTGDAMEQERTQSLLMALSKLYEQTSKETASDFENIESRLLLELARIYERQGVEPSIESSEVSESTTEETSSETTCTACKTVLDGNYKFCPKCGASSARPSSSAA